MTATRPCYRHPRRVWMLACPDCTAWHLPAARARRDELAAVSTAGRNADPAASPPATTNVSPSTAYLVA
jgi:hypothetical protein